MILVILVVMAGICPGLMRHLVKVFMYGSTTVFCFPGRTAQEDQDALLAYLERADAKTDEKDARAEERDVRAEAREERMLELQERTSASLLLLVERMVSAIEGGSKN